jgi:hypothetical protein
MTWAWMEMMSRACLTGSAEISSRSRAACHTPHAGAKAWPGKAQAQGIQEGQRGAADTRYQGNSRGALQRQRARGRAGGTHGRYQIVIKRRQAAMLAPPP